MNHRSYTVLTLLLALLLLSTPIFILQASEINPLIPPTQWFEPNQGQSDSQFGYIGHDRGYRVFLGSTEMAYSLVQPPQNDKPEQRGHMTFVNVHMQLTGAKASTTITGETLLPGVSNYLNSNGNFIDIPHYGGIRYNNLYDGIDMTYSSSQSGLQYDFQVAPGANPSQIRLHFTEIEHLEIAANGDLLIHAANQNVLTHKNPYSYQSANGVRQEVHTRYVLLDDHTVGFQTGDYDTSKALVIDPPVVYSTYIGGETGSDTSIGIAVDAAGHAYIAGQSQAPGFPTTPGALDGTYEGYTEAFVTKLSADGSTLIYSTYLGGSSGEYADSVAVDNIGNAYVTGGTQSVDFPITPNAFQTSLRFIHVSKLNAAGNALLYSTYFGGTDGEESNDIAVDNSGNAYVTGYTRSTDFPTRNAAQAYAGGGDAFVTRLNTNAAGAASLVYSTYIGGNGGFVGPNDSGQSIAVDALGNAYITGETYSSDFPTTTNAYDNTLGGARDSFVIRLNTNASGPASMIYSTLLGGTTGGFGPVFTGADISYGITADNIGNAYIAGQTYAPDFPVTAGAWDTTFQGGYYDSYVAKINTNASGTASLVYATFLGGDSSDDAVGIAKAKNGVYVVGYTMSNDFPTLNPSQSHFLGEDAFLTGLNADGSALTYSTYFGGSFSEHGLEVAVDPADNVYFTGFTRSNDFPTTNGAFDGSLGGGMDGFVVKMGAPSPTPLPTLAPNNGAMPTSIAGALDLSISKIGFLVSGQTGNDEQVQWIVKAWNPSTVTGNQVVITDTVRPDLRIDHVQADKGTVTITNQTIKINLPSLAPNEQTTVNIFTTSTTGTATDNTACVSADHFEDNRCASAQVVRALPSTGETPWWRTILIGSIMCIVLVISISFRRQIYGHLGD